MKKLIIITIMGIFSFLFGGNLNAQSEKNNEDYKAKLNELTKEQIVFINENVEIGKLFLIKYSEFKNNEDFEFKYLDIALDNWKKSNENSKEKPEKVIDLLGAIFGNKIIEKLNFEWKIITDQYGTDFAVIDKKYFVTGFPFSSVEKSVFENRENTFVQIYEHLIKELNKGSELLKRD